MKRVRALGQNSANFLKTVILVTKFWKQLKVMGNLERMWKNVWDLKKKTKKRVQFPTVVQAKGSIEVLERLSKVFTANLNLYHVTKFAIYLSFTVYYNYMKISRFTPILSMTIVLSCFYLLISHIVNFSTWISCFPFAINTMLSLSINAILCILGNQYCWH